MNKASSPPISTGLMAYGMSGKVFHAPFLEVHKGFSLDAVIERNKKLAATDYPSIKSYDTIEQLLNDSSIELIVINTPSYLHYEHAKAALLAGKHILVEKPFAARVVEAQEIFNLGKKLGLKVMVYQNRRYSSDFLAAKKVIQSGVLGNIIEAHFRFDRYKAAIGPKAFKETPYPASGTLYDLGAHLLDQMISVFGLPESYQKTSGKYREGSTVDDFGHFHLKYAGGINVFITVSLLVAAPLPGLVVHGTKGSFIKEFSDLQEEQSLKGIKPDDPTFGIENPGVEGMITLMDANSTKTTQIVPSEKGNMLGIFEAAYQTIRNNVPFPVKEEETLKQLEILES